MNCQAPTGFWLTRANFFLGRFRRIGCVFEIEPYKVLESSSFPFREGLETLIEFGLDAQFDEYADTTVIAGPASTFPLSCCAISHGQSV